ncbi:hypothetical protein ACVBEG_27480 [Pseudomonas sp. GG8]
MHHEEPPAQSLLDLHGIARGGLLNLGQLRLRITDQEIAHVVTPLELRSQNFDGNAHHATLQLHEALIEVRLYIAARMPNAPSFPMFAVSIAAPFAKTVNSERTAPFGK